jgi:hypothetical protein
VRSAQGGASEVRRDVRKSVVPSGPQALPAELRRAVDTMKALASGSQHE